MSITDELRKWAHEHLYKSGIRSDLLAIADRIDVEHEKAMSRAGQLLADAEKDRDYNYANWQDCKQKVLQHNITLDELSADIERLEDELAHCIELPKDADGEYVRIGDKVTCARSVWQVTGLRLTGLAWGVCCTIFNDHGGSGTNVYPPCDLRHYHAPTVEDVLREFVSEFNRDDTELCDEEIIERFAAKLRLAGSDDE